VNCRILRALSLKSDGHLSCDDSNGYELNLGRVTATAGWKLERLFTGPLYAHVRRSFSEGRVPWPGTCETCDLFSAGEAPADTLNRELEVRVEPTLECRLRCPSCKRGKEAAQRNAGEWFLDPGVLRRLLEECRDTGRRVPLISYLGWGEPLEHPRFDELVGVGREVLPTAAQELTTIGHADFRRSVRGAVLDRIIVSCDGVTQAAYERYRKGGDLAAALRFMGDAKRHAAGAPVVQWKYIVFEHTDAEEDLLEAQRLADALGVDSLLFILTNSKGRSPRFTPANLGEFPLVSPRARVSPAAALQRAVAPAELDRGRTHDGYRGGGACFVDSARLTAAGLLQLEGWALGPDGGPVERLDVRVHGRFAGSVRPEVERRDVMLARLAGKGTRCGFVALAPVRPEAGEAVVDVVTHAGERRERFAFAFRWSAP
jgi:hypothetical protein